MPTYRVTWAIDVDAATPEDAARLAQEIQRDCDSLATVFEVHTCDCAGEILSTVEIDLEQADDDDEPPTLRDTGHDDPPSLR